MLRENTKSLSSPFGGTMMPSLFGGRDPFDDPFFTDQRNSSSSSSSQLHQRAEVAKSNGPTIHEIIDLDDDDDDLGIELDGDDVNGRREERDNKAYAPIVEHPDDEQTPDHSNSKSVSKDVTGTMKDMKLGGMQSNSQGMSYRRVTYGGINGAYYTATTTRKTGSDGMVLEESKQADRTTGQATHSISRGIHDKGHSLTRKLASDGKVETMQTLHNLGEDDLAGFEQKWNGDADNHMPGWKSMFDFPPNAETRSNWLTNWETGFRDPFRGLRPNSSAQPGTQSGRPKKVVRINIE